MLSTVLCIYYAWSMSEYVFVSYLRLYLLSLEEVRTGFCVLFKVLLSLEEVRTGFYVLSKVLSVKPGVGQNTILCAEVLSVKH